MHTNGSASRRRPVALSPAARSRVRRTAAVLRIVTNADAHTAPPPARWWHGCKMAWFECPTCEEYYSARAAVGGRR